MHLELICIVVLESLFPGGVFIGDVDDRALVFGRPVLKDVGEEALLVLVGAGLLERREVDDLKY